MVNIIKINTALAKQYLEKRSKTAHKGDFGTLNIVGGCASYRGAPVLSAMGAHAAGTGIIRICSTEKVCAVGANHSISSIFLPCNETERGFISKNSIDKIITSDHNATLCGPGLGVQEDSIDIVCSLLKQEYQPIVLDADALNILSQSLKINNNFNAVCKNKPVIITPHIGEMARLCNKSTEQVQAQQIECAVNFSAEYNCVTVLKSYKTVVASPRGKVFVHDEGGNAGLAKGGSGDVLSGIAAGFMAQGYTHYISAVLAVWLHSTAAFYAVKKKGSACMLPEDIVKFMPNAYQSLAF